MDQMANILIVDDNPVSLLTAKNMLESFNVNIKLASSGKQAIQEACQETFDVILLDLLMPDMDGIETARQIHKVCTGMNQPYIVATTGMTEDELNSIEQKLVFADILKKPLQKYELKQCLEQWFPLVSRQVSEQESEQEEKERAWNALTIHFKDTKEINLTVGRELTNGNVGFFTRILKTSIPSIQKTIESLQKSIEETDSVLAHQQLHAVKSVFAYIGASGLAMETNRMDVIFQQRDTTISQERYQQRFQELNALNTRITAFLHELEQAMNVYNSCIQKDQNEDSISKLSDRGLLKQIDNVLFHTERFEYIEIVRGLHQLYEITPKEYEDMIENAMEAMEEFDYDMVTKILTKWKNQISQS